MNLIDWLRSNFHVRKINHHNGEIQLNCPVCSHEEFYFNIYKKLGHCFRDSCLYNPSLSDLTELVGDLLFDSNLSESDLPKEEVSDIKISLPGSPIAFLGSSRSIRSNYPQVVSILSQERSITPEQIIKWNLHTDGRRVYVPVYFKNELISYVGRVIWGLDLIPGEKRYKYPSGSKVSEHLFGFDEAFYWNYLVLCENTFNAIAYREHFNCSTNFGSHLSRAQVEKIVGSPYIHKVILLWDSGAELRAEKAVKALEDKGIRAYSVSIKDQPDSHSIEDLKTLIKNLTRYL